MRIFKMNGMQISSPQRFLTYFSPADFLRNKELAAGFVYHQLRILSKWHVYNSNVLYDAVFDWKNCFQNPPSEPSGYFEAMAEILFPSNAHLQEKQEDAVTMEVLNDVWALTKETDLTEEEQKRLFSILSAGYLLAEKTPAALPISPAAAAAAFLGQETKEDEAEWVLFTDADTIVLPAKLTPYRILLREETGLPVGEALDLKKIIAAPHSQGSATLPLLLELYHGEGDRNPQSIQFLPGDYRFCTFAAGMPVEILDTVVTNGSCHMERNGHTITLSGNGKEMTFPCEGDVISFAPEANGQGCIIVTPQWVDASRYSLSQTYRSYLNQPNILQVQLRGTRFLLLDKNGYMSDNLGQSRGTIASLKEIEE